MNLIKIENKVTIQEIDYNLERTSEKVFKSPLVSKIDKTLFLEFLMQFITKLHNDCGQKVNAEDLVIQSNELLNTTLKNYNWITLNEIPEVFSLGRKKTFGDWYGLNLNTYELWIDGYYSGKRANEIKKKRLELKPDVAIKPTPEENKKAFNNLLTEMVLEYQSENKISNVYLYNLLFKKGYLPKHSKNYITAIRKRAIKKKYKSKSNSVDSLLSNKRIALLKLAFKKGFTEKEAIELLKKHKLKDFPTENYGIKKELKLIQNGKKNLTYICKEIILIDFINKKNRKN